jgi:subfamily B ATP-binding cassette protein HlyB/CyaB
LGNNRVPATIAQAIAGGGGASTAGMSTPADGGRGPIHPRLLAMMMAARYYGLELDPHEFRLDKDETQPTAAALSVWAQSAGMWSRALRLKWRHLFSVTGASPVVLLFNDGSAGLLTGANVEAKIVFVRDPRAPEAEPPVPVDEMRLSEVWSGEVVLLRAERSQEQADPPFTLRWLVSVVMKEGKHRVDRDQLPDDPAAAAGDADGGPRDGASQLLHAVPDHHDPADDGGL